MAARTLPTQSVRLRSFSAGVRKRELLSRYLLPHVVLAVVAVAEAPATRR